MSPSNSSDCECIVIGAGLAGLASAYLLSQAGKTVRILEARSNPGGRIQSVYDEATKSYVADLGPTWVWPAYQPVVVRWIDLLKLESFPQFETGKAIIDYGPGTEPVPHNLPGQHGIARISGGPQAIIDALIARLPTDTLVTDAQVEAVTSTENNCQIRMTDGREMTCEQAIIAVPPRIAASTITWTPQLSDELLGALNMMPTWMAPHAKVAITYDHPFWRDRGLSGRIASQAGPIVEAHDHSGPQGTPAALFGFIGWPASQRAQEGANLEAHIRNQLKRCFGPDSPEPTAVHLKDWASDPLVASQADLQGPMAHPETGPQILREGHCNGRLRFAAAETSNVSPGLIEGALAIAELMTGDLTVS